MVGDNYKTIIIPITKKEDLERYERSILSFLNMVEIDQCDAMMKDNVKALYQLLTYLVDLESHHKT